MTSIIEQAIQLEKKAEAAYREAAQATSDPSASKVLAFFADEEAQHAEMLRGVDTAGVAGSNLLQSAQEWIRGAVEGGSSAISSDAGLLAVLRQALTIEQQTESFYREQSAIANDAAVGELFTRLADAEKEHFLLVGSLVEYFDRPNEWVESAEFGQRDEY